MGKGPAGGRDRQKLLVTTANVVMKAQPWGLQNQIKSIYDD